MTLNKAALGILLTLTAATTHAGQPSKAEHTFKVDVVGKGRPVILIPGLTCSGNVWDATVAKLKGKYECHVLTLPGFGSQPPIEGPYLSRVRDDIVAYVKEKKLDHPAVIGHSLGGFMCFSLGSAEPKLFGPLVAVDGVPYLAPMMFPGATVAAMKPRAEMIGKMMADAKPETYVAMLRQNLKGQVTADKDIEFVFEGSKHSSPANAGEAMKEMLTTDLREDVAKVQAPVLLIAAGQWAQSDAQKKMLEEMYRQQIAKVPNAKLEVSWKSKHFVQLDDPEFFLRVTEQFLASAPWPKS